MKRRRPAATPTTHRQRVILAGDMVQFNARLPLAVHTALKLQTLKTGQTMQTIAAIAIAKYLFKP